MPNDPSRVDCLFRLSIRVTRIETAKGSGDDFLVTVGLITNHVDVDVGVMLEGGSKQSRSRRTGSFDVFILCSVRRKKGEKMKLKSILYISVSLTIAILWGCSSGTYQMYPGPRLPRSQVVFLQWDSAVNVISIDGKFVPRCNRIEMFPGEHNLQVGYSREGFRSRHDRFINFTAEAGHRYRISHSANVSSEFMHWDAWVEDITRKEE